MNFDSSYCQHNCLQQTARVHESTMGDETEGLNTLRLQEGREIMLAGQPSHKSQDFQGKRTVPRSSKIVPIRKREATMIAPKHAMVLVVVFRLSAKDAEVYTLFLSEVDGIDPATTVGGSDSIPTEYQDLHEVFGEEYSNELLEHRISDMKIEFKEGQEPGNTSLRPMLPIELEELQSCLEENLSKGWIRRSKSPVSASVVFAWEKDRSIRVCIDYINLNKVTIRNHYPLLLIPELTD